MRLWVGVVVVVVLLLCTPALAAPTHRRAEPHPAEGNIRHRTNHARVIRDIHKLRAAPMLHREARQWARHMVDTGTLSDPTVVLCNYQGGNVGEAINAKQLFKAWMRSPAHRRNILDPNFHRLGVGTVRDNHNTLWGVQIFCG